MESKKVYARQVNCDDTSIYMDDEGIFNSDIVIARKEYNRFYGYNVEGLKDVYDRIVNYSNYEVESYYKNNIAAYIIDNLRQYKKISLKQALKIADVLKDKNSNYIDVFLAVLSAIKNKEYGSITIRGCCQDDYATLFYVKKDMSFQLLQYIEAVYFNTGFEIMIHDDNNIPIEADDICGYTFYTASYKVDDIKQEIADQFNNVNKDDVILYMIEKTITIYKDIYKEV